MRRVFEGIDRPDHDGHRAGDHAQNNQDPVQAFIFQQAQCTEIDQRVDHQCRGAAQRGDCCERQEIDHDEGQHGGNGQAAGGRTDFLHETGWQLPFFRQCEGDVGDAVQAAVQTGDGCRNRADQQHVMPDVSKG